MAAVHLLRVQPVVRAAGELRSKLIILDIAPPHEDFQPVIRDKPQRLLRVQALFFHGLRLAVISGGDKLKPDIGQILLTFGALKLAHNAVEIIKLCFALRDEHRQMLLRGLPLVVFLIHRRRVLLRRFQHVKRDDDLRAVRLVIVLAPKLPVPFFHAVYVCRDQLRLLFQLFAAVRAAQLLALRGELSRRAVTQSLDIMRKLAAAAALALKSVTSGVEIVQQLRKAVEALRLRRAPVLAYRNAAERILIISGPNAGGKSVCLKTVGLLQYMLQCGMPVPMHERSHAGLFGSIFIDIGDEQSIEDDLSTYSSHLTNMKTMMKSCNERSLILIDEFGGGTEPQIGGAIAEAVLKRFNEKGTFGVITTHYQNLKHFAEDHEGVVNGAMLYDRHLMQALFQLQIGNPGSSFAVEIARKIGLPEEVIADASEIVGSEYINADKYLQDIVRDKRYWETKRQNIRKREKQMEETIAKYEEEIQELEKSRKEILRKAKEDAEKLLQESNARIENTIRIIKEAQADKERTRLARQELADFKNEVEDIEKKSQEDKIARKMEKLREKQERKKDKKEKAKTDSPQSATPKIQPVTVGAPVKIKGQSSVGEVLEINGKNAVVMFGMIKTNVKLDRLERCTPTQASPKAMAKSTFVSSDTQDRVYEKKLNFKQDIDVRGMRGDEAIQAVTYFIDDAILLGIDRVRILHGTGTGILRTLIRSYLGSVPGVEHYQDEHVQFGGAGITVVDLK